VENGVLHASEDCRCRTKGDGDGSCAALDWTVAVPGHESGEGGHGNEESLLAFAWEPAVSLRANMCTCILGRASPLPPVLQLVAVVTYGRIRVSSPLHAQCLLQSC